MFHCVGSPYINFLVHNSYKCNIENITIKYEVENYPIKIQTLLENDCAYLYNNHNVDLLRYYNCPKILNKLFSDIVNNLDYIREPILSKKLSQLLRNQCEMGNIESIKILVEYIHVEIAHITSALFNGNIEIIEFLMNYNKPNIYDSFNIFKRVCESNNYDTVVYLITKEFVPTVIVLNYMKKNNKLLYNRLKYNKFIN